MTQAPVDLSQFTPEEQKLIADCFQRIRGLSPQEQEAVIQEMLPPELAQKIAAAMGQAQPSLQPQGFQV